MSKNRAQGPDLRIVRDSADAPDLPGKELEPIVYEGELMPDPEPTTSSEIEVRKVGQVVAVPQRAPHVGRGTVVAAVTVGQGWHSWLIRAWDGLTLGVYRRQIRIAETVGDREALADWTDRKHQAIEKRRARLMDLPKLAVAVGKVAAGCLAATVVLLVLVAILVAGTGAGDFADVFIWAAGVVRWLIGAAHIAWIALLLVVPLVLVVAGWREGRRKGVSPPQWLVATTAGEGDGRDVIPDEGAILAALRNLGISALNKAFKAGWRPRFVLPTERDGKGYHTQLELPPAVTVEMINDKKKVLAHNLVRFPIEVWPTEPRNLPGVLDMWVADQGTLSCPVDPWPLLHKGVGDYFRGVPAAVDIRGKIIIGRLSEANYAAAGQMGSGKSTLFITLLLGALLDPLVDADVFVMADNADYEPMKPRLRTLRTGQGDEVVEACMSAFRGAYNELSVRGKALREHDARAVTRELAEKDSRLRPRIFVVDECQALFMHDEYGEEAVEIAVKLESAARKYAVTLMYATPEPTSDSLPRKLITITSNKACFAIGDQISNDAILGTGSYKAGISAVGLEPKTDEGPGDVGTFMARGFTPKPGLLRGFYVSQTEARAVVERAMKIREKAGIGPARAASERPRDLLADLSEVMATSERMRLADLPGLLRNLAPTYSSYATLTGLQLRDILTDNDVRVTNTGNVFRLDPADLRRALADREGGE